MHSHAHTVAVEVIIPSQEWLKVVCLINRLSNLLLLFALHVSSVSNRYSGLIFVQWTNFNVVSSFALFCYKKSAATVHSSDRCCFLFLLPLLVLTFLFSFLKNECVWKCLICCKLQVFFFSCLQYLFLLSLVSFPTAYLQSPLFLLFWAWFYFTLEWILRLFFQWTVFFIRNVV